MIGTARGDHHFVYDSCRPEVDDLSAHYPGVLRTEIESLMANAHATVRRMTGLVDPGLAADLARLRLDVRTRRFA